MRRGLSVCGGPSGSAARPCTGVFNGSVAPPGYGLTCPQDSTIGYYPGMRCNKVLTLSTNAYSNIPITFHVHNPTTLLVLYRLYIQGSHFRATPLRRAIHLQLTYFPSGMPVTVAPATPRPISCPPNPNPDTRQTTVSPLSWLGAGVPLSASLTRLSATLPSRRLPPSHPSLCNDIL